MELEPETFEDAVNILEDTLMPEMREIILTPGTDMSRFHHGWGTAIRNAWLWDPKSFLAMDFRTRFGVGHADDMSAMLFDALQAKVRGVEYDPHVDAAHYQKYWLDQGINPLHDGSTFQPSWWEKFKGGIRSFFRASPFTAHATAPK